MQSNIRICRIPEKHRDLIEKSNRGGFPRPGCKPVPTQVPIHYASTGSDWLQFHKGEIAQYPHQASNKATRTSTLKLGVQIADIGLQNQPVARPKLIQDVHFNKGYTPYPDQPWQLASGEDPKTTHPFDFGDTSFPTQRDEIPQGYPTKPTYLTTLRFSTPT